MYNFPHLISEYNIIFLQKRVVLGITKKNCLGLHWFMEYKVYFPFPAKLGPICPEINSKN